MAEPRRWTLVGTLDDIHVEAGPLIPDEEVHVREDRATDADIEAVGRLLAAWHGEEHDYEVNAGGVRDEHDNGARDLLALVFSSPDKEGRDV
ncbi:MAG: hypothetical protein ACRDK4_05155 [Solirubrobacteraceae bacterium]